MNLSKSTGLWFRIFASAILAILLGSYGGSPLFGQDLSMRTLKGHTYDVTCVVFSPNGKTLATGDSGTGTIRLWDPQTGILKRTLEGQGTVHCVAISLDGKTLAWNADHTVKLIKMSSVRTPQRAGFAGRWDVSAGPLTLNVQGTKVTGSYPLFNGQVEGLLSTDGKSITGTWKQANGVVGGFELKISPDAKQIVGRRWTGKKKDDGTGDAWSGKRIGKPIFSDVPPAEQGTSPQAQSTARHPAQPVSRAPVANNSIEGDWKVVECNRNGRAYPDEASTLYRFKDGRLTVKVDRKQSADLRYTVDTSKVPHHLDLTLHTANGKQSSPMIFQVDGDELLTCYAPPGQSRPDSFTAANGSTNTLVRMRRWNSP